MESIVITYPNNSRQLKGLINLIFKKDLAEKIKRINYVKSYTKNKENKIDKEEQKIIIIFTYKKEDLINFLKLQNNKIEFLHELTLNND